jgi:hypothetical protein
MLEAFCIHLLDAYDDGDLPAARFASECIERLLLTPKADGAASEPADVLSMTKDGR